MPLMPFLVATGFLATILLVWGQLWASVYSGILPESGILLGTVYLGQIWTFLAVTLAVIAFALVVFSWSREDYKEKYTVGKWPIGLLVTTLIMTGVNVGQSLVSVFIKFIKGISLSKPLIELATPEARHVGIIVLGVVAVFIIVTSLLGTKWRWVWIVEVAGLFIFGILAIIAYINGSLLFIQPLPK